MENPDQYKYFAFISYRGADVEVAKKLQRKFNNFKLPSTYINPFDHSNHRMQPVCRDRDYFVGGEVSAQIKDAIDHSMYVVMVCTPNMTQTDDHSNYVNDEIRHLIDTGRLDRLIPLVFDGKAYSPEDYEKANRSISDPFPDECLPYALREWMSEHNKHDFTLNIFGIEEQGERDEEKMFLRCVATILAEEFSKLWDRFTIERKKRRKMLVLSVICIVCAFAVAVFAAIVLTQPKDITISLNEYSVRNENLPDLKEAVVTIALDDYMNSDTVARLSDVAVLDNVPYGYLGKDARLTFSCRNWMPLDTVVHLRQEMIIDISRDPSAYGDINFRLWNEVKGITYPHARVSINGHEVTADYDGRVKFFMPLEEQDTSYVIGADMPLEDMKLHMPITESTVIIVKDSKE